MMRLVLLLSCLFPFAASQQLGDEQLGNEMYEGDRVAAYYERNYTWPLEQPLKPDTEGWTNLFMKRFAQVSKAFRNSLLVDDRPCSVLLIGV
jgi:hypothetical protein